MQFFDSHAHLSSLEILPHIQEVMTHAKMMSVSRILNICTDLSTLNEGLLLEKRFPEIKNAGATTPHDVEKEGDMLFPVFAEAAQGKRLVAIGETGLDYYYKELNPTIQKRFLKRYLHLAAETKLPVIFHCREAFADLFAVTDDEYPKGAPAVLHCFTGSLQEAHEVLARGWYLSISGIVTFKKSQELREVAKMVPLNQLLIETDAPYLAPQSKRGKQNEPAFIRETAELIAAVKGVHLEEIARASFENGAKLFSF